MNEAYELVQLYLFVFTLLLSITIFFLAKWKNYFTLPPARSDIPVTFKQNLGAFGSYLLLNFFVLPLAVLGMGYFLAGSLSKIAELPFIIRGWIQQAALLFIFLWFLGYSFLIEKESRCFIYGKPFIKGQKKSVGIGFLSFAISYPIMIVVSLLFGFISYLLFKKSGVEQTAVTQLKSTLDHPLLFAAMFVTVTILVPFVEELLFRGFLQSWLLRHFSRRNAILLASFIFALAHFELKQGVGNIELIASLFVLSCFLGFIYERQRTLIAPITMHATFNAFSALMLMITQ